MDPILDEFERAVAEVEIRAPAIPLVSSVTGGALLTETLRKPAYWARHVREPFDHGDNKRDRLPGTGLCTTDDVPALKAGWNGLSLNGSGNQQARGRQIPQK